MECKHFGTCGSCLLHDRSYAAQVAEKTARLSTLLASYYRGAITPFTSPTPRYRARAEYKIYHENAQAYYCMRKRDGKGFVKLEECPMVIEPIARVMWPLMERINRDKELADRLFGIEFLAATTGEVLVTMLYHRRLEEAWREKALTLAEALKIKIIGRSRKQKIALHEEFVTETFTVEGRVWRYRHYEQSFTQPNPYVNAKMLAWALHAAGRYGRGDFCELYAGSGNFTLPLSVCFGKVLATEISKRAIKAAKENCALNDVKNVTFVRMSSEEFAEALSGGRTFNRLKEIDLTTYDFKTVLVDPPRAGLDEATREVASRFDTILYVSCNPETLARDLSQLHETHKVVEVALFDQFPYTPHTEAGAVLIRRPT